jgi:hypothetical protein
MMSFIRPRWRKPAGAVLAGAVFAAAWIIRGGPHSWEFATLFAVLALGRAFAFWVWGGEESDAGAVFGSRGDERQKQVGQQSWALTGRLAMLAAFIGLTVAVAVKATWWWPFLVMFCVTGAAFLLGLAGSGFPKEGAASNHGGGHQLRSPVNF